MFQQDANVTSPRGGGGGVTGVGADAGGGGTFISPTLIAMTEEELENVMENFAHEDAESSKTYTRIFVESVLSRFGWYAPRKDLPNAPSLSKAYAYYEHITLPRHFVGQLTADHVLRRCEPGETQPTELYSPLKTPSSSLIEWGIGVDLYFSTLRIMAGVLLLAGLIHLPNIVYYRSNEYSPNGKDGLAWSLRGSAVCTTTEWVACSNCDDTQWDSQEELRRIAYADDGTALVQRNACDGANLPQGILNWIVLFYLVGVLFLLSLYLGAREVRFDEDKVTSTDYSVIVKNPPKDAYNPDEWRDFFSQFAEKQVTFVTVAINNELLLRKLCARRIHRNNLRLMLPKGTDMDDETAVRVAVEELVRERDAEPQGCIMKLFCCTVVPIFNIFNIFLPAEKLVDKVFTLTNEIKKLQEEKYDVSKVFVTFETEEGQRAALTALSNGRFDILMNNKNAVAPSALFRGQILRVEEPSEPSAVRWFDLSASTPHRVFMRVLNFLLTVGMVLFSGYIVGVARFRIGAWLSAPLISISNTLIPLIVKILMIFEPHSTEGSFQTALYLKITLFRWANTALLIKLITPWTSTLEDRSEDVIPQINAILWSELWLVPLLRLGDLWGNFKKHILAPRARTQELMNLSFQGTKYNLGERYTDLTKVLFVCFFYSSLYPAGLLFGTAILIVQYYVDKFCLMRIWSYSALIGSEVARFSRRYFFSGAVLAYAIFNAYAWAGFPYDNICDVTDNPQTDAAKTYVNVFFGNDTQKVDPRNITVVQDEFVIFCRQKWSAFDGLPFPPTSRSQQDGKKWMHDSQETLTNIYGWTAVVFLIGFISLFFGSAILDYFKSWFHGIYYPKGQKQDIDFSSNKEIFAFVPQIRLGGIPFPVLACNIDNIDQALIGWNDPTHSYDYHNLIFDVPWENMPRRQMIQGNTRDTTVIREHVDYHESSLHNEAQARGAAPSDLVKPLFSIVKHYPPAWKAKLKQMNEEE